MADKSQHLEVQYVIYSAITGRHMHDKLDDIRGAECYET